MDLYSSVTAAHKYDDSLCSSVGNPQFKGDDGVEVSSSSSFLFIIIAVAAADGPIRIRFTNWLKWRTAALFAKPYKSITTDLTSN